jgi:hypothetical protein
MLMAQCSGRFPRDSQIPVSFITYIGFGICWIIPIAPHRMLLVHQRSMITLIIAQDKMNFTAEPVHSRASLAPGHPYLGHPA